MGPPVLCFGFQRSGTTLLSAMLDSHPQLAVPFSVTGLWLECGREDVLEQYERLSTPEARRAFIEQVLLADGRLQRWNVPFSLSAIEENLPLGNYAAIIKRFHTLYARHHGKQRWGHFDIASLTAPDRWHAWFPDARFVHLVRDARAVALSNQGIPFSLGNILECAERWRDDVGANLDWGRALPAGNYQVVQYEALVAAPETTLRELCGFLDLDYSPAMLHYPDRVAGRVPPQRLEALWPLLEERPRAEQADRWKSGLSPAQRALVESVAGDRLGELGYSQSRKPDEALKARALKTWYGLGRGGRWPRLARRMGVKAARKVPGWD